MGLSSVTAMVIHSVKAIHTLPYNVDHMHSFHYRRINPRQHHQDHCRDSLLGTVQK